MASFMKPPPEPKTKLGYHRKLAPNAGIHVSPIQLGAMNIGDKWNKGQMSMGAMDKESSFKLLDAFYEAGGNFIDTANNYQDETSEMFLGEWMEERGIRDQIVLATKFTSNFKQAAENIAQKGQFVGNNTKSLHLSVEASLKKLRTTYIDILYLHWWDYTTPVEEIMNALHSLVAQGKVLYLGISDTPAWIVSKANMYARMSGKTPFVIYQGAWNLLRRDLEREILPMVQSEGMALAAFMVLAGGKIRSDAEEARRRETGENGRAWHGPWERTEDEKKVCAALEKVAEEVGAKSIGAVAIAWVMQKYPYVFPLIGGRKVEQLYANLEALDITLTPEHFKTLEGILPFDKGYPMAFFGDGEEYNFLYKLAGHYEKWPSAQPIRPIKN